MDVYVYIYIYAFFLRWYMYIDSQLYATRLMSVILEEDYFWFRACDVMWVQMYWTKNAKSDWNSMMMLNMFREYEPIHHPAAFFCSIILLHFVLPGCEVICLLELLQMNRWIVVVGSVTMCVMSMFVNSINWINIAIDWHEFVDSLFS